MKFLNTFILLAFSIFAFGQSQDFFYEYAPNYDCGNGVNVICGNIPSAYSSKTIDVPEQGYFTFSLADENFGGFSTYLQKVDYEGNQVFLRRVGSGLSEASGGTNQINDFEITDMIQHNGFLYILSNVIYLNGGTLNGVAKMTKLDLEGQEVWTKIFGTEFTNSDEDLLPQVLINDMAIINDVIHLVGTKYLNSTNTVSLSNLNSALFYGQINTNGILIFQEFYQSTSMDKESLKGLSITVNQAQETYEDFQLYIGGSRYNNLNFTEEVFVIAMKLNGTPEWQGILPGITPFFGFDSSLEQGMTLPIVNSSNSSGDPILFCLDGYNLNQYLVVKLNGKFPDLPMKGIEVLAGKKLQGIQIVDAVVETEVAPDLETLYITKAAFNGNHTLDFGFSFIMNATIPTGDFDYDAFINPIIRRNNRVNSFFSHNSSDNKRKYVASGIFQKETNDYTRFINSKEFAGTCYGVNEASKRAYKSIDLQFVGFNLQTVDPLFQMLDFAPSTGFNELSFDKIDFCSNYQFRSNPSEQIRTFETQNSISYLGNYNFEIKAEKDQLTDVYIYNIGGQLISSKSIQLFEGDNTIDLEQNLNVSQPSGMYFISLICDGNPISQKFIHQQ